jgi:hypothetical protein
VRFVSVVRFLPPVLPTHRDQPVIVELRVGREEKCLDMVQISALCYNGHLVDLLDIFANIRVLSNELLVAFEAYQIHLQAVKYHITWRYQSLKVSQTVDAHHEASIPEDTPAMRAWQWQRRSPGQSQETYLHHKAFTADTSIGFCTLGVCQCHPLQGEGGGAAVHKARHTGCTGGSGLTGSNRIRFMSAQLSAIVNWLPVK